MHRSLMSMLDLPVISEQGVRLGGVTGAYFDPSEHRIIAFEIDWENDLVRGPEDLLPITQISELNADIVTVPDELGVTNGLEYEAQIDLEVLLPAMALIDLPVRFEGGEQVGKLVDVHFDPEDGSVGFYEITADDARSDAPSYLLAPLAEIDFQPEQIVLPQDARPELRQGQAPQMGVTFVEDGRDGEDGEEAEELVGEEDIEVSRSRTIQPY